jgi:hypothetical protein
MTKRKGFSLVDILFILAIIAIVLIVVVPIYRINKSSSKAVANEPAISYSIDYLPSVEDPRIAYVTGLHRSGTGTHASYNDGFREALTQLSQKYEITGELS